MKISNVVPKTILVIEDEQDILISVAEFLKSEGYNVLSAVNGLEALEILKKSVSPNLILLDMKMPVMDGWEFAQEYLAIYDHKSPIVVMTAASEASVRAKSINATGWIEKPFNLDMLLDKIKKIEK